MSDRFAKGHGTSWDTATPNIQINAGAEEFVTRTQGASDLELESLGSALFTHPMDLQNSSQKYGAAWLIVVSSPGIRLCWHKKGLLKIA